jgi:hypothetical protein
VLIFFFFFRVEGLFQVERNYYLKVIAINFESNGVIKVLANQLVDGFNQVHSRQAVPDLGKSVPADNFVQVHRDMSWVLKGES